MLLHTREWVQDKVTYIFKKSVGGWRLFSIWSRRLMKNLCRSLRINLLCRRGQETLQKMAHRPFKHKLTFIKVSLKKIFKGLMGKCLIDS